MLADVAMKLASNVRYPIIEHGGQRIHGNQGPEGNEACNQSVFNEVLGGFLPVKRQENLKRSTPETTHLLLSLGGNPFEIGPIPAIRPNKFYLL
ncbi:MAG: hypothetical protein DMG21_07170 [Acidobacteria bacterium]|nr:MAG: hypothetical protein DMG21_07170 [Acidobacteriota bacterium]